MYTMVQSSFVRGFAYSKTPAGERRLMILFRDGAMAVYNDVPSWLPGLLTAHSVSPALSFGRFYNRNIRGRYRGQNVTRDEARGLS